MTDSFFNFKDLCIETLQESFDLIQKEVTSAFDTIVSEDTERRTFENTVQPHINVYTFIEPHLSSFEYATNLYSDEKIRDKASELKTEIEKFLLDQNQRVDVYNAFQDYDFESDKNNLTTEEKRYYEHEMRDFRRYGLHLTENRTELIQLQKELTEITNQFSKNINDENTSFEFTRAEIEGLPESWFTEDKIVGEDKIGGENIYKMTLKYPDYMPAMQYINNREIRKRLCLTYQNRCATTNTELFKRAIKIRYKGL